MKAFLLIIASLSIVHLASLTAFGDDWPQYRGPERDGISRETHLRKEWPPGGPPLLWTASSLGLGYSGPAVVGNQLYVSCGRENSEYVIALDISSDAAPKELWSAKIGPLFTWAGNSWNIGPNATPTVDGDLLYAIGGNGDLLCVETSTGKPVWHKTSLTTSAARSTPSAAAPNPTPLGWGYAWAPLVDGDKLICVPGGKHGLLAALDKKTGQVLWQSREVTAQAPYSSPIAVEVGNVRQYVQVINAGIVGIAAKDGKLLWSYHRESPYDDVVIATPIFHDNHVFATVGFGQGCDLIKLLPHDAGIGVEKVFSNKTVQNRNGGVVLIDGHLYGHSENRGWFCSEFDTGKILWSDREKLGRGSVTYADGNLYCCAEKGGAVALVEASPKGWNEKGRLTLPKESQLRRPSGCLWTPPVVANGRLYIRDEELLFCYDLRP